MKPKRVYIDTSVVGGCFEAEFESGSVRLFERFRDGTLIAVVSDLLAFEILPAPERVRDVLDALPAAYRENVLMTGEARVLGERYIREGVIARGMLADALHIATATVYEVDVLASWNFKHIVNSRRIHGYSSVNVLEGRIPLQIRTPAEVVADGG